MAGGSFFFNRLVGTGWNYTDPNYTVMVDPGERLADLGGHNSACIFCHCRALVRLPIRGAQQCGHRFGDTTRPPLNEHPAATPISQEALTKFIRSAPGQLRWPRSGLSKENMGMLGRERPGAELLG